MCEFAGCPVCEGEAPETETVICPDCSGEKNIVSDCCGEPIIEDTDFCSFCREHCGEEEIICETCKGEGTIQILIS